MATIPINNMTDTWNNAGVTFTSIKMNVTNTASAAGSLLMDLQIGGSSIFDLKINSASNAMLELLNGGSSTQNPPNGGIKISQAGGFNSYLYSDAGSTGGLVIQGTNSTIATSAWFSTGVQFGANIFLGWTSTASAIGTTAGPDTAFYRDSQVGVVGLADQASKTTATGLRIYNTTDSIIAAPTNYERGVLDWTTTANVLTIGTQKGGTGSSRNIQFVSGNTAIADYNISNTGDWFFSNAVVVASPNFIAIGNVGLAAGAIVGATQAYAFSNTTNSATTGSIDTGVARAAANVIGISNGGSNASGWLNWGGEARVTADVTQTSTTTLTNVTGLTVNVQAGRTYSFQAELSWTDAAAGGIQAAIAGTCTATNIIYDGWVIDSAANGTKGNAQATALGGAVANTTTTGTAGHLSIYGTITVNAAGTLTVQSCQSASNATSTTIKRGSYFWVQDMP